jgi:signal transduction histidine kinase
MLKRVDLALAAALFTVVCVVGATYHPAGWRAFDWLACVFSAAVCLPLALRRTVPVAVLVATSAAYTGYIAAGFVPTFNWWGPVLAFYTVAAQRPPRTTAPAALLLGAVLLYSGLVVPEFPAVVAWAQALVVPGAAWGLGDVSRRLAAAKEELRARQEERTARALTDERLRIARELHDVVAHHLSVISMQAGLADYVFDSDSETARKAVTTIGTTSRETLEEMRRLLNLLRASEAPDAPTPGLAGIAPLIARLQGSGVEVSLDTSGDLDDLPPGLQLTVYRVVQEALTNVLKHVGPCTAEVTVRRSATRLTTTVTNSPPLVPIPAARHGHGLIGMRERARIYHGTLTAGPLGDGGFLVELVVPLGGASAVTSHG